MYPRLKFIAISVSVVVWLLACSKVDKPPIQQEERKCRIISSLRYENGSASPTDRFEYLYTDSMLTRVDHKSARQTLYYTFEYANDRIVRRNVFVSDSIQRAGYRNIIYDVVGKIIRMDDFLSGSPRYTYEFEYVDGKIKRIAVKFWSYGMYKPDAEYNYTYAGLNITRTEYVDFASSGNTIITLDYSYDNTASFYKKMQDVFLVDPLFFNLPGFSMAAASSANNIISILTNGRLSSGSGQFIQDSLGNLQEMIFDEKKLQTFAYECF